MSTSEWLSLALLAGGVALLLLAAVGLLRFPDVYCRSSASTKAATLGIGCILAGAAFYFGDLAVGTKAMAAIAFTVLTSPLVGHLVGRSAAQLKVPMLLGNEGLQDPPEMPLAPTPAPHPPTPPAPHPEPPTQVGG